MPSNVLLGMIIDIADQPPNCPADWVDLYWKLLPRLVLKIALHHKFHLNDGQLSIAGNSLHWNYVFTKNGRSSQQHLLHRNNFSEFNKNSYDQFLINYNKITDVEKPSLKNKIKPTSNINQLLKQLSDLITMRFDWDISLLTSPVIVNKSKKSNSTSATPQANAGKYHYMYYLSLGVVNNTSNTNIILHPKSSSLPTIYNYLKRNAVQFAWLPFLYDNNDNGVYFLSFNKGSGYSYYYNKHF